MLLNVIKDKIRATMNAVNAQRYGLILVGMSLGVVLLPVLQMVIVAADLIISQHTASKISFDFVQGVFWFLRGALFSFGLAGGVLGGVSGLLWWVWRKRDVRSAQIAALLSLTATLACLSFTLVLLRNHLALGSAHVLLFYLLGNIPLQWCIVLTFLSKLALNRCKARVNRATCDNHDQSEVTA